jgi:acyl-coenzyme A thioesterase PaaI-like protein
MNSISEIDVTKLPFNQFIGLKISDKNDYLLMLDSRNEYRNHLDTVHASALFSLAEATSGHYLISEFSGQTDIVPLVRKVEVTYRKPTESAVYSKAKFLETQKDEVLEILAQKGRVMLKVEVSLFDQDNTLIMKALFEWFVSRIETENK